MEVNTHGAQNERREREFHAEQMRQQENELWIEEECRRQELGQLENAPESAEKKMEVKTQEVQSDRLEVHANANHEHFINVYVFCNYDGSSEESVAEAQKKLETVNMCEGSDQVPSTIKYIDELYRMAQKKMNDAKTVASFFKVH